MRATVTKKDRGLARLLSLSEQMKRKPHVKVGVLGTATAARPGGGIDNVALALIHEFGVLKSGIASRPFLRSTFDAKKQEWNRLLARLVTKAVKGSITVEQLLDVIGLRAAADVKNRITRGSNFVALKLATIKRKGSSRPLVDTGRLVQSISHQVVRP